MIFGLKPYEFSFISKQALFLLFTVPLMEMLSPVWFTLVCGIWVALTYAHGGYVLLKKETAVSPMSFFLLFQVLATGISSMVNAACIYNDITVRLSRWAIPPESLCQGMVVTLLSNVFIMCAYFASFNYFSGRKDSANNDLSTDLCEVKLSSVYLMYGLLVFVRWIDLASSLSFMGKLPHIILNNLGYLVLLIHVPPMIYSSGSRKRKLFFSATLLTILEIIPQLHGFAKAPMLKPLLVWAVYLVMMEKVYKRRFICFRYIPHFAVVIYFVVVIFFPFFNLRRARGYEVASSQMIEDFNTALVASVPFTDEFNSMHKLPNRGLWHFFSRASKTQETGFCTHILRLNGNQPLDFLTEDMFVAVVPRILWPDKPLIAIGRKFAIYLKQGSSFETVTTQTGTGLAGALMLSGGWFVLIAGSILNGVFIGYAWSVIHQKIFYNYVAGILYLTLLFRARKLFAAFDGNFADWAYWLVVLIPLVYLNQCFLRKGKPRSKLAH